MSTYLLKEDGGKLLKEDGGKIALEIIGWLKAVKNIINWLKIQKPL